MYDFFVRMSCYICMKIHENVQFVIVIGVENYVCIGILMRYLSASYNILIVNNNLTNYLEITL